MLDEMGFLKKKNEKTKKHFIFTHIITVTTIAVILLVTFFVLKYSSFFPQRKTNAATSFVQHFTAGFSIESSASIATAASLGVDGVLNYGANYTGTDSFSQQLAAKNMKIIDDMPFDYLYDWEHGTISQAQLITDETSHLQSEENNSLIIGYWVLDDWTGTPGAAKPLLQQITALIHQYTPGKPAICGFGGGLSPSGKGGSLEDNATLNFSPTGCDMVDLYIYGDSGSNGTYDWGMTSVLPGVFSALKAQGWDQTQTPLVGSPQAFGGVVDGTQWPLPDAAAVEAQAKAYCQNGAIGLIYYDFSSGQNVSNDTSLQQGVKAGVADCQAIWGTTGTTPTGTGSPTGTITPTGTIMPTITGTTGTPTMPAGSTAVNITVCPHGLGKCGDNANTSGGNTTPQHTQRSIVLNFFNNGNVAATAQGTITYTATSETFQGTIPVSNLSAGQYVVKVATSGFLTAEYPTTISFTPGQTLTLPEIFLVNGDINNDNQLDILDYNLLISCYGSKQSSTSCSAPITTTNSGADIDDDKMVGGSDYNLFLRELSVQKGA